MEVSEATLELLAGFISQTLSPDPNIRKPAEKQLISVEGNKNYPILLLHLVDNGALDPSIRVSGAIAFKNFVKRNWDTEDDVDKIHADDRLAIKQQIVNLMLKSPENIQRQLSDAISVIGRSDFPSKWQTLMPELVEKFKCDDFHVINGVLRTAHSLFKRYRFEFKSNELWGEIKLVLEHFARPLTELLVAFINLAKQHENNKDAIKVIYSSLLLVSKIFFSLNSQEIPEFFEDNMNVWMPNFHTLLVTDIQLLKTGDDEEAGLLEQLRSQICDNVGMYAQKYDEEFQAYLPQFVTDIWTLLVTTGNQTKYDLLVSNAIQFLALVAGKDRNKKLFEDPNTMSSICQKVIIPNMEFREADEELFEDNAEEYIRRDIEGSDVDTRRRAACDLVRALSRHFEVQMTSIFGQYIQEMLVKCAQNPQVEWKSKDAAIYLVTSLVAKGQTQKEGVTKTNDLVNIQDFFQNHILPELSNPNVSQLPVLKADAIKYVMIFRSQLPPSTVKESVPLLVTLLTSESAVVYSYAASAIEKILLIKIGENNPLVKSTDLSPIGQNLLGNLFGVLGKPAAKENEYIMKAVMRSLSTLQEAILPLMPHMLPKLLEIIVSVARNPSKPHFNHYMFESLCLCIRIMCRSNPGAVEQFEAALFPIFQGILQHDVSEFIPYVFQVLALMLDFHPTGVTEPYMALLPCLTTPTLWEKTTNIPPLVRLLQTFIEKGPQQVAASDKLPALLGVFQKLIASKQNDHEGFALVQSLIENMPTSAMLNYLKPVLMLLFQRLTSSRTVKFVKCLLVYFGSYIIKYGALNFIETIDSIEPNFMAKVLDRIFIADLQKVSGPTDKRICAVGVTKLLCDAPEYLINGPYALYWSPLLQALIQLFELPEDQTVPVDEHFAEIEEITSYQSCYAQLNFGGKKANDQLKDTDVKMFLVQNLGKLSVANPGKLRPLTSTIAPAAQNFLFKYLAAANVQLA